MRSRLPTIVTVLACLSSPLVAEPDVHEVLKQAAEAFKAVRVVQYEATGEAEGFLATQIPKMQGTVTIEAIPGAPVPKLRMDARMTPPNSSESLTIQVACDGNLATMANHGRKMFTSSEMPQGTRVLSQLTPLLIHEFAADQPLERELQAVSVTYTGVKKVGDVECDTVHAVFAENGGEVRWHFGRKDHLPRRVQRIIETPTGKTSLTIVVSKLNASPQVSDDHFRLSRPAGFGEIGPSGLLAAGSEAPDWTLKDAAGKEVSLRSLRGKIVLLDFWATWCQPCLLAMPNVDKLYKKYRGQPVVMFGLNCFERDPRVKPADFMTKKGFSYPVLLKADRVAAAYLVRGIPTFYLIGPDGRVLMAYAGLSPEREHEVDKLINETLKKLASGEAKGTGSPASRPAGGGSPAPSGN